MNTPQSNLAAYLNDHLAGAVGMLEVLDELGRVGNGDLDRFVHELRYAVTEDREELEALMRRAGIATSAVRRAAGWISEKAVEVKVRVDDPFNGAFRTFELLEIVALGIDGKRALWPTLRAIADAVPQVQGADYHHLAKRADDQRDAVEARRGEWARNAFATTSEPLTPVNA
jgi:hypothetical protein